MQLFTSPPLIQHERVRVGGQPHLGAGVIVAEFDESAL